MYVYKLFLIVLSGNIINHLLIDVSKNNFYLILLKGFYIYKISLL